jgi:quinol monooxygenase YgiN
MTQPTKGLIIHAFGEENGKWVSVGVWESQAAFERYRDERILPAMRQALRDAMVDAGPPPQESFEVKHIIKP